MMDRLLCPHCLYAEDDSGKFERTDRALICRDCGCIFGSYSYELIKRNDNCKELR